MARTASSRPCIRSRVATISASRSCTSRSSSSSRSPDNRFGHRPTRSPNPSQPAIASPPASIDRRPSCPGRPRAVSGPFGRNAVLSPPPSWGHGSRHPSARTQRRRGHPPARRGGPGAIGAQHPAVAVPRATRRDRAVGRPGARAPSRRSRRPRTAGRLWRRPVQPAARAAGLRRAAAGDPSSDPDRPDFLASVRYGGPRRPRPPSSGCWPRCRSGTPTACRSPTSRSPPVNATRCAGRARGERVAALRRGPGPA